jgi:hypothetical protein
MNFDGLADRAGGEDAGVDADVDGGSADGGDQGGSELARVETPLFDQLKAMLAGSELRKDVVEVVGTEDIGCGSILGERLQGGAGVERDRDTGESVETFEEGWVEGEAEVGERTKLWRVGVVTGCQHSGSGSGGLHEWSSLLEDGDAEPPVVEFQGEREADDAGPSDTEIRMLHETSLVLFGEVIVWG